ncbi:MAG: CapA family protein [Planctomycetia bacterium]|nr:CapA family protein [Planctomycetia bacterium]
MKILFAGDLAPSGSDRAVFENNSELLKKRGTFFRSYDYVLANLEMPLIDAPSPIKKSGPVLSGTTKMVHGIRALGINGVTLANNHIRDHGNAGVLSTCAALDRAGINRLGAGRNLEEASQPLFLSYGDSKIAILSFAEREFSYATKDGAGANPFDLPYVIRQLKSIPSDYFKIVVIHGGNEYFRYPYPALRESLRLLTELGAELIICHHSHCICASEIYESHPIFYGLGNFIFTPLRKNMSEERANFWNNGLLVAVQIENNRLISVEKIPIERDADTLFSIAQGDKRDQYLEKMEGYDKILADEDAYKKEWNNFCMQLRQRYAGALVGFRRIVFLFNKYTGLSLLRVLQSKDGLRCTENLLRCPAHHEVLKTIFDRDR